MMAIERVARSRQPSRSFDAGRVLGLTFALWARNFIPFTGFVLVGLLPVILFTAYTASQPLTLASINMWTLVAGYGSILLNLVVTGAIVHGVFQQLRGKPAGF